jgi:DNA invertase Pin-like site-specific DNA recombinase
VFKDVARRGTRTIGRDQFLEMVDHFDGEAPEAGILLWEYARFSRDYDDTMYYIADLRRRGIQVYSITDAVPEGLEGRLLESIIAWKNARYSEDLRKNVKRGHRYVVRQHKAFFAGKVPVGFRRYQVEIGQRRDGTPHLVSRLEPDPNKVDLVRKAYRMRAEGRSYSEINTETRLLNHIASYNRLFKNPLYIGKYNYDGMLVEDFCEPIVDQETWDAVQKIMQDRVEKYRPIFRSSSDYLLTGMLFCAKCGKRMRGSIVGPAGRQIRYYRCTSHHFMEPCGARMIPRDTLEEMVISRIKTYFTDQGWIEEMFYQQAEWALERIQEKEAETELIKSELSGIERKIKRLVAAITDHGHSQAMLDQLRELEDRQEELQTRILIEESTIVSKPDITEYQQLAEDVVEKLESADRRTLQLVLRTFTNRIVAIREETDEIKCGVEFYLKDVEVSVPLVG